MSNKIKKSNNVSDTLIDNAGASLNASANNVEDTNSNSQPSVEDVLASLYDELDALQLNREHNFYVVRSWLNLTSKNFRQVAKKESGTGVPRLLFKLPNGAQGEAKRHPDSPLRVKEGDVATLFNIHQVVNNEFAEEAWGDEKDATQRQILVMKALIEAQKAGNKPAWYVYEVIKKESTFRW